MGAGLRRWEIWPAAARRWAVAGTDTGTPTETTTMTTTTSSRAIAARTGMRAVSAGMCLLQCYYRMRCNCGGLMRIHLLLVASPSRTQTGQGRAPEAIWCAIFSGGQQSESF